MRLDFSLNAPNVAALMFVLCAVSSLLYLVLNAYSSGSWHAQPGDISRPILASSMALQLWSTRSTNGKALARSRKLLWWAGVLCSFVFLCQVAEDASRLVLEAKLVTQFVPLLPYAGHSLKLTALIGALLNKRIASAAAFGALLTLLSQSGRRAFGIGRTNASGPQP